MTLALVVAGLLVGAIVFWLVGRWFRGRSGFGQADLNRQLVAWDYGITGKPDYILDHDGQPVPVLIRSGKAPGNSPHESHVAQVLVYCLLVEQATQLAPPFGVIRYANRTFEVDYDEGMYKMLVEVLEEMHNERQYIGQILPRSHNIPQRCYACGHRKTCDAVIRPDK